LTEISVVDRPANPEAVFDCWKRSAAPDRSAPATERLVERLEKLCGLLDRLLARDPGVGDVGKLSDALVPRLEALQKRVDDIARTPLPPQTAARGLALSAFGKSDDVGPIGAHDVVAALARMTDEERTLTLIKAAHASPVTPFARR
jgi:hypothetical protein